MPEVIILIVWTILLIFAVFKGHFESPKIFLFYFGSLVFTIEFLKRRLTNISKIIQPSDFWYWGFIAALFVSSIFGIHPWESIIGGNYRHQGVLFFIALWVVAKSISFLADREKKVLVKAVAWAVIFESLVVVIESRLLPGLPVGTFGNANAVAGFLGVGSYFVYKSFKGRFPLVALFIFLAILVTGSRAGLLSFFAILLPQVLARIKSPGRKVLIGTGALVLLGLLIYNFTLDRGSSVFESRNLITKFSVEAIFKRPLFGYGAESGEAIFEEAYKKAELPLFGLAVDRAHNLILDILIWSGALGLFFFSGFLVNRIKEAKSDDKVAPIGILGWLIFSFFQPLGVVHWLLFAFLLGVL